MGNSFRFAPSRVDGGDALAGEDETPGTLGVGWDNGEGISSEGLWQFEGFALEADPVLLLDPTDEARMGMFDARQGFGEAARAGLAASDGLVVLRCMAAVADEEENAAGDEKTGLEILRRALSAPTRRIAENSAVDGGVMVAKMPESEGNIGFDATRKAYIDLVEAGILDPTKVMCIARKNAVSTAAVLLLTEATMTEIPEPEKLEPASPEMAM